MDTENHICHDLKTERADVTQPLPGILAFLPILFVLSVVGAIVLNVLFFLKLQNAEKQTAEWKERTTGVESEKGKLAAERKAVVAEEKKAKDAKRWVEGSSLIQPLVVAIAKSTDEKKTSISELSLFRDVANPEQIRLGLKLSGETSEQLETTLDALSVLGYRAYQAQQTHGKKRDTLDYQATLIKKSTGDAPKINISSTAQ